MFRSAPCDVACLFLAAPPVMGKLGGRSHDVVKAIAGCTAPLSAGGLRGDAGRLSRLPRLPQQAVHI